MSYPAITVRDIGKMYRIGKREELAHGAANRAKRAIAAPFDWLRSQLRDPTEEEVLWAVRDVSFDIPHGEAIGLIGRNGAGKSTLLKILSRITEPSAGHAEIEGHVASLLEVGTGMHPELTGRENIFLNGCILGMAKEEVARKFDDIVDFSGISKFIDTPVKRYSSGMRVRLGFAIASQLEPEILLIDEVLAVGDAEFQRRCLGRMHEVTGSGRTILFVSHNMSAIRNLTSRCIYMADGRVVDFDTSDAIVDRYLHDAVALTAEHDQSIVIDHYRRSRDGDEEVSFTGIQVGEGAEPMPAIATGSPVAFTFSILSKTDNKDCALTIALKKESGETVAFLMSRDAGQQIDLVKGNNRCRCTLQDLCLLPGRYFINAGVNRQVGDTAWDALVDYPAFEIVNTGEHAVRVRPERPGMIYWSHCNWETV